MKGIASKFGMALFVLAILFFGLKSCVLTVWKAPSEPTTYAVHGADGRSLTMIFLPNHETIIFYTEEQTGSMETVLTQMRGSYGTHYFWRLWNVDGSGGESSLFGYRIYPAGARPVVMETTVQKKFIHGSAKPTLSNEGESAHPVILFSENAVRFEGMWLEKETTEPELVQALLRQLKPTPQ